jgi:hypothetical protein
MVCTEEEAKKKWCPMARVSMIPNGASIALASNRDISLLVPPNSFDPNTDVTKCLASGCMMWREISTLQTGHEGRCGLCN